MARPSTCLGFLHLSATVNNAVNTGGWVTRLYQVPHCPPETSSTPTAALGAWRQEFAVGLSLRLESCCDYTSEEQCERPITKLQACTPRISKSEPSAQDGL